MYRLFQTSLHRVQQDGGATGSSTLTPAYALSVLRGIELLHVTDYSLLQHMFGHRANNPVHELPAFEY